MKQNTVLLLLAGGIASVFGMASLAAPSPSTLAPLPVKTQQVEALPVAAPIVPAVAPTQPEPTPTIAPSAPIPKPKAPVPVVAPNGTYTNAYGNEVPSPYTAPSIPAGASAQCRDGTYSFSQNRRGTCSHHGGVAVWY